MKRIRIDHAGDGWWIMHQVGNGAFTPGIDHSICTYDSDDGRLLGGFVCIGFTKVSMVVHMAGQDPRWCSRDLMWMLFDYAFNQLGVVKLLATVSTGNTRALELDLRAGWRFAAIVRDVYDDGHMIVLSIDRTQCKWLKHKSKHYRSGSIEVSEVGEV